MCMVERGPMRKGKALCVCGGSRQNGVKGQLKGLESTDSYKKQQQQRVSLFPRAKMLETRVTQPTTKYQGITRDS